MGMEVTIRFPEIEYQLKRCADALEKIAGSGGSIVTPSLIFKATKQESEDDNGR